MSDIGADFVGGRIQGWLGRCAEDFDLPPPVQEPEVIPPSFSAAEVEATRAETWADGHAAGSAEANGNIAATTRALLADITATLRAARAEAVASAERSAEAVARLLMDSLSVVLPAMCARHGEAELRALARTILPALSREPCATVRLNPAQVPALQRELDRLDPDLIDRVQLIPVETIPPGNLRASWQDGVAVRDTAELWRQVREVLEPAGLLTHAAETAGIREIAHAE